MNILSKKYNLQKDLEKFMEPVGQKELQKYRERVIQEEKKISDLFNAYFKESNNFIKLLITLALAFLSFQIFWQKNAPFLAKLGGLTLGLSVIMGVLSLFYSVKSQLHKITLETDGVIFGRKLSLDFFKKFYENIDISSEEWTLKERKKIAKEFKSGIKKGENAFILKIIRKLKLFSDNVEKLQWQLFILGMLLILISMFNQEVLGLLNLLKNKH